MINSIGQSPTFVLNFWIISDIIHKIHKLIKGQQTGSPEDLASLICVSRRELYYIIEVLKNMGAEINYNRKKQSFCYTNAFDMDLSLCVSYIGEDEMNLLDGGTICLKNKLQQALPCRNFARNENSSRKICGEFFSFVNLQT